MTEEQKPDETVAPTIDKAKQDLDQARVLAEFVRSEVNAEEEAAARGGSEYVTELDFDMVELAGGKWVDHEIIVNDPANKGRQLVLRFQTWVKPFSDPDVQTYFQSAQTLLFGQKGMEDVKRRYTEKNEVDPKIQRALLEKTLAYKAVERWRSTTDPNNTMPLTNMACTPENVLKVIGKFRHVYTDMIQALFDDASGVNLAGEVASGLSKGSDAN